MSETRPIAHLVLDEHRRRALAHPDALLAPRVDLVAGERGDACSGGGCGDESCGAARARLPVLEQRPRVPPRQTTTPGREFARISLQYSRADPRLDTSTPASWPSRSTQWRAT